MWTEELESLAVKTPKHASAFSEEIAIDAPIERVWRVLADIGSVHAWNPGVRSSRLTTHHGEGVGAARHCKLAGRRYLEEVVVDWEPLKRLTVRITATNLPFEAADVRFMLRATSSGVIVSVSPRYTVRFGFLGTILEWLVVGPRYRRGMKALLDGLKAHVENLSAAKAGP
ncbi:MAG: SRPBCC family protein [Gemmatimonadetes bacterium]|nr:SRPBCC family protein [Gemmatimonadota bacterium]